MHDKTAPLSRRNFIATGGTALAGLGLLGMGSARGEEAAAATAANANDDALFNVPMDNGEYLLPPLPYAYNALEPSIDAETMRLHHDIHFESYRVGLNNALAKLADFRAKDQFPEIAYWENQLAFHGAGYNLHVVFFDNMAPAGTTAPSAFVQRTLTEHFGTMEGAKAQFSQAAATVQGSGWAILGWQPFGRKLIILQAEKHQNLTQWAVIPILALDVWEHAYYLKYQNRRTEYIQNWWLVVNWQNVEARLRAAMMV